MRRPGTDAVVPALLTVPAVAWWMVQVGFHTIGWLDTGKVAYPGWVAGTSSFPEWPLRITAYVGVPAGVLALLVVGGAVALHGRRALLVALAVLVVAAVVSTLLVMLGTWIYPDAPV